MYEFSSLSDAVFWKFWVLPRNRLAGMHMPPGGTLILSPFLDFWYELPGGESGIARRCITIITVSLCCCEFCEIMNSPLFSDVLRLHIVIVILTVWVLRIN